MITVFLLFSTNIIALAVVHSSTNQRIDDNERQISSLILAAASRSKLEDSHLHRSWEMAALTGASQEAGAAGGSSSSSRNMQLSLMSMQTQLAAVRALAEKNSQAAAAKDAKLDRIETAGKQMMQMLMTEGNITLCIKGVDVATQQQLISPVDGIFHACLRGRVRTSALYANMKMFELRKNNNTLKSGGVIRARDTKPDVACVEAPPPPSPLPDCLNITDTLLVRLAAGDSLDVREYVTAETGGALYDLQLCLSSSQYRHKDLPAGLESLLVTHL